ncbi:hypothetical protein [Spiroplasma endosymbiont of Cleonymus obscurus]|uniref:hypothetical protein n=1 Tax=Spiroplasma endosymbiont of Cleonymus obscurus TaxID=3066324 RepID=UPI0037DDA7B8
MRKIIRFFLNYILVSATTINVIACRWGCTNNDYDLADENEQDISGNYIVPDINKRINKVVSDRINFIEGEDAASLKQWYLKNPQNWFNKTSKKLNFVTNLEEKIQYQAKKESINEFNLLANNKSNFTDFSDLQNQINITNLGKTYTNINWDTLINSSTINANEKAEIKDKLVRFYNIFAQIYGKKNVLKLLYRVAKINKNGLFGFVKSGYVYNSQFQNYSLVQVMAINPNSLSKRTQYWQYVSGYKASKSIIRTIVHEYGHALGSFIRLNFQGKQRINSLADNDPKKWWNNHFNSSYLLKDNLEKGEITDETNYMISSLANGTKINDPIYQKLLAYGIVRSEYGRESHLDLFAEAFDQWIDTEESQRNIAWEKLDNFFRIDLPRIL